VSQAQQRRDVSQHILPTSATMLGVCVTVVGIVRLMELTGRVSTIIDNVVAIDSGFFLLSCVLSYLSLRTNRHSAELERYGDLVFIGGLVLMVVAACMLAWELGTSVIAVPVP
jgi:hypothetical protein